LRDFTAAELLSSTQKFWCVTRDYVTNDLSASAEAEVHSIWYHMLAGNSRMGQRCRGVAELDSDVSSVMVEEYVFVRTQDKGTIITVLP